MSGSTAVVGITHCQNCGEELETTSLDDSRPVQPLTRSCPSCNQVHEMAMLWYPDEHYVLIGDTVVENEFVAVDSDTSQTTRYNLTDAPAHILSVYEEAVEQDS